RIRIEEEHVRSVPCGPALVAAAGEAAVVWARDRDDVQIADRVEAPVGGGVVDDDHGHVGQIRERRDGIAKLRRAVERDDDDVDGAHVSARMSARDASMARTTRAGAPTATL